MKHIPSSKSHVKKLDGRRLSVQRSIKKRAAAGHQARGVSLMIHGRITSKRDPDLQKRIDEVVAMAQKKECDHNTDMINGFHHIARASLKCHRVG